MNLNYDHSEFVIDGSTLIKYTGNKPQVLIPDGVTSIGKEAFADCKSLESVTIPTSVTVIDRGAFWNCSSLTSVAVPDGVTFIAGWTFCGCKSLESVTIPDSVTSIGPSAFQNCTSLISIIIPDRVTSIGSGAFYYCASLESIRIPDGITFIYGRTFQGCDSLVDVNLPQALTRIENMAFSQCSSLQKITLPGKVEYIGEEAFSDCPALMKIELNSLPEIHEDCFSGVQFPLMAIIINGDIRDYVKDSKYSSCSEAIRRLYFSKGFFSWCFYTADGVEMQGEKILGMAPGVRSDRIEFLDFVEEIPDNLCENHLNLVTVVFPSKLRRIGAFAFEGCYSLKFVELAHCIYLQEIGSKAFRCCFCLDKVTLPGSVNIALDAFEECHGVDEGKCLDGFGE